MTLREKIAAYYAARLYDPSVSAECSHKRDSMLHPITADEPLDADATAPRYNGTSIEDMQSVSDLKGKPDRVKISSLKKDLKTSQEAVEKLAARAHSLKNSRATAPAKSMFD